MQVNRQKTTAFLQKLIFIVFNLLFFLTPFIFTWMNQELFEFSKMLFVYAMTSILVGLWLMRMVVEQKLILKTSKLDYFLLAFLISQIISTIFSLHVRTSWFGYYTRFNGGLLSTITYITLFYAFISNIHRNQLRAIFSSFLLSALLISLYAIPERFSHSPSCWLITQKFDTNCWSENNNPRYRVFATFGQPNWLAAFLIAIIPLNISQLLKEKKIANRLYLLLVLVMSGAALVFTKSRSGLLGLAIGLGFYALLKILLNKKQWVANFLKISGFGMLAILLALLIAIPLKPSLSSLFTKEQAVTETITTAEGGTPSEEIRKIVWQGAFKVWQRYPIFGSGVETFAYSYYLDRPVAHNLVSEWDFLYNKAHNELLNLLANSGLVGLISYLSLIFMVFYLGVKNLFNTKDSDETLALLAGILAVFVSNFFGFSTVVSNLLLFGFFAMIILQIKKPKNKNLLQVKNIEKSNNFDVKDYLLCSFILLITALSLNKVYLIWRADYLFTQGQNSFNSGNRQLGLTYIQKAIQKSPQEAFFYDELAENYAGLSIKFANDGQSTASAQLAQKAIESNRYALQLNPVHLNFYKSQARLYIRLGQLDSQLYSYAEQALRKAITLAPTDAKLYYNLALILELNKADEEALATMEYAVAIKENYLQARNELARMYFMRNELEKAQDQYLYSLEKIAPNDELLKEKLQIVEASLSAKTTK